MGGAVSAGKDNDELVDNLCYEDYIHTPEVEQVFRQVDRADFMTFQDDGDPLEAYEDHAWRRGTLHLSAPCIYTRAMEALKLKPGISFLNVGSGTGYMSTMVGLLIGPYGINHGIEIYQENVEFAQQKLEEFLDKFSWYDPLHFCEPLFVVGNGLLLSPGNILYDRIYCGAACPPQHAQLMKNMLAIGGILVMPHDNQLESIRRVNETKWEEEVVLPSVSFAPLILPSQESVKDLEALEIAVQPLSLKQSCRLSILKELGRERYCRIPELPLPQPLKEYVSYYKQWGPPLPPVKSLCPIDHTKRAARAFSSSEEGDEPRGKDADSEEGGKESGNGRAMGEGSGGGDEAEGTARLGRSGRRRQHHPFARSINISGRRMLICNFSGIYVQIPIDSDEDNGSAEASGSDDEKDQYYDEAPDDIILDESADEASEEETDFLLAEDGDGSLMTVNSVSSLDNNMVSNTTSEDSVSMEAVSGSNMDDGASESKSEELLLAGTSELI